MTASLAEQLIHLKLDPGHVRQLIADALAEDVGGGDLTAKAVLGEASGKRVTARISAKAPGVVAGVPIAGLVFLALDPGAEVVLSKRDGDAVVPGDQVLAVTGDAAALVTAERTVMNFLGRLSGIATLTRRFREAMGDAACDLCDTRKTTPGWRLLEKAATTAGGCKNHRIGLYDQVLIKENHLRASGLSLADAVAHCVAKYKASDAATPVFIGAEAETLDEFRQAVAAGADMVLLDEFSLDDLRTAVKERTGNVQLEASGGITLDNIRAVAETGVDRISVGALTHSAKTLDLTCLIDPVQPAQ